MPRVQSYGADKQNAVRLWIRHGILQKGLFQKDLAKKIGMPASTLSNRLAHPGTFKLEELWNIEKVIGEYFKEEAANERL